MKKKPPLKRAYEWIMAYSQSPQAPWVLALISFAESSFFPFPPDPLLGAMILSNRERWKQLCLLCTVSSVAGGILGYFIGFYLFQTMGHWILETYGLEQTFGQLKTSFQKWGFWIVALKGLTPIPYKLVTITSGVAHLDFISFVTASFIARFSRFFVFSLILWYYGEEMKKAIEKSLGILLILSLLIIGLGFLIFKWI